MENILSIKNLTKKYKDVGVENISFNLPKGSIVGLIGRNGAGKTTTIKAILNIVKKDSGEVTILGDNTFNEETKNKIGVVFDGDTFPENLTIQKLNNILKLIYKNWEEEKFYNYIKKMELPLNKKIKTFSKGMKTNLSMEFSSFSFISSILSLKSF